MRDVIFLISYLILCFGIAFFFFNKYSFFRKAKGFLSVLFAGFLAVILHNLIYAMCFYQQGGDEPVFFILALFLLGVGSGLFYFWLMRKVLWESKLRSKLGIKEKEYWTVSVVAGLALIIIVVGIFSLNSWQRLQGLQKQYWWVAAVSDAGELTQEASFYCLIESGTLEIRKMDGKYQRFCIFKDQTECEVKEFYLRKCKPGENVCQNLCGDGECQEVVCQAVGCPCAETLKTCPADCPAP